MDSLFLDNKSFVLNKVFDILKFQTLPNTRAGTYLQTPLPQCRIGLLFFPLHYFHSFRDGLGVKKSNLFSFFARIEPKLSKFQKTVKIDKKSSKNFCFLVVFLSLLNFGTILAQKLNRFICKKKIGYFDTQAIPEAVKVVEWEKKSPI